MIKDLKIILVFFSSSLKDLFSRMFFYFLYFLFILGSTLFVLFYHYKHSFPSWVFYIYFGIVIIINTGVKRIYFKKYQFSHNLNLLKFLDCKTESQIDEKTPDVIKMINKTRTDYNRTGDKLLSKRTLLSITLFSRLLNRNRIGSTELNRIKADVRVSFFLGYLFLLILAVPYIGISFIFTIGLDNSIRFFILIIGFMFVYFLYLIIIEPILYLYIQKKVIDTCLK